MSPVPSGAIRAATKAASTKEGLFLTLNDAIVSNLAGLSPTATKA
jgi:hypothetical protein